MCFGSKVVETTAKQELPQWLEDEAKRITQQTAGITDMGVPYVPYGGERLAPLTTEQQMAKDVVTFLAWAAEPHLEARHKIGFKAIIYLIIISILAYLSMKRLWSRIEPEV